MSKDETDDKIEPPKVHPLTQAELDSKDKQIVYLQAEIDKLSQKIRAAGNTTPNNGANPNNLSYNQQGIDPHDISAIYTDIDNLMSTIEQLRRENMKLRLHLKQLGEHPDDEFKIPNTLGGLKEKIRHLESLAMINEERVPRDEGQRTYERARIIQLETEQNKLLRQLHTQEDLNAQIRRELEAVDKNKGKVEDRHKKLNDELEAIKNKCLDVVQRNSTLEAQLKSSEKERTKLSEGILKLQAEHTEEIQGLKKTLELTKEKIYLINIDNDNRKTYFELDKLHTEEKKAYEATIRNLNEKIDSLNVESGRMESKLKEQHSIIMNLVDHKTVLEKDSKGLKDLQPQHSRIKEELLDTLKERDDALLRIRSLEREVYMLKEDKNRNHEEIQNLITIKTKIMRERDNLDSQLRITQEELQDFKAKYHQTQNEKGNAEKNLFR